MPPEAPLDSVRAWIAELHEELGGAPVTGVVLGSGLGEVADLLKPVRAWDYAELPGVVRPSAAGHAGRLLAGFVGETPCLFACGRVHLYEGHRVEDAVAVVRLLAASGIARLWLTNAAGGVHPDLRPGELMAITDHINLLFRTLPSERGDRRHEPVYAPRLIEAAERAAMAAGFALRRGVYAAMLGPTYETRSEYRMLRKLGADAVGMSTVLEALAARSQGIEVGAVSVITNAACPDRPGRVSHGEVVGGSEAAAPRVAALLGRLVHRSLRLGREEA